MEELLITSTSDDSQQPSLFYKAGGNRPLLVGLHTWSFDRYNQVDNLLPYAQKLNWNLLLPEFRGPNKGTNLNCTDACGSKIAKQDIIDATIFVTSHYCINESKIFLIGGSGGGHMALLMSAYAPDLWNSIVAFVPITSLSKWYEQNLKWQSVYYKNIRDCCFGKTPCEDKTEYSLRSPMNYLKEISNANLKIFHGKYDPVVPVSHSLEFYNEMQLRYPNARTFLEIFDGGHELLIEEGIKWFVSQISRNNKKIEATG